MQAYRVNVPLLLILMMFIPHSECSAQFRTHLFEQFTIADGLSNNSINCILQTRDGFLWIATKDGLNRYDGQNFVIFRNDPAIPSSLPENYVMCLYESRAGVFWVGTWGGGLCKYDPAHETFIKTGGTDAGDKFVQCIDEAPDGTLWFGTLSGGLFTHNTVSGTTIHHPLNLSSQQKTAPKNITAISITGNNNHWIGTWGDGLLLLNPQSGSIRQFAYQPNKNSVAHNNISFIQKMPGNNLMISSDKGFDLFDTQTETFTHNPGVESGLLPVLNSPVRQTFTDSYNRLWVGTYEYQGLLLIDKTTGGEQTTQHITKEENNPRSLTMNRIRWIYQDRKKNMWFGTEDGLNKLPATKPFVQYRQLPGRKKTLGGKVVSSIVETADSILWIGYAGSGIDRIDLRNNSVTHFQNNPKSLNSIIENDITALLEDRNGIIWIGTAHNGLNRYDPKKQTFTRYPVTTKPGGGTDLNWIQQILETKDGLLLVGTNAGIHIFNRSTGAFNPFRPEIKEGSALPEVYSPNALYEDSKENLWIGTWLDGLYRYSKDNKTLTKFVSNRQDPNSISADKIPCILEDRAGFIWVGTHSGGLNKFDPNSGKFYRFTTAHGLPNDVVFGIQQDNKGFLWVSTNNGLARLNPATGVIRTYDVYDGIVHNQFNWHAHFKNNRGVMYFGTVNGFISFHPDSVVIDPDPPAVVLTSFKIFGKEAVLPQSISEINEINLNYDQNFFSIDFSAMNMVPGHKHQYSYILEGIDPDWVFSKKRSSAFYTNVNPGTYKFMIKACNADGIWSKPVTLAIIIAPAWWMTWWFKVVVVILLSGIGYLIYMYRLKQALAIQNIRLNLAHDLHDEIGSNLSSISVDSQMLMNSSSLSETEKELTSFIVKTSKETIETLRDIIWFINPQNDFDTDMIVKMKETAAKLLAGIEWNIEIPENLTFDKFNLEVRRNIFLIYKESVNNLITHSGSATCSIQLVNTAAAFILKITDKGVGFDKDKVELHTGLKSMQRRAEKIHGALVIESIQGAGTTVTLTVPYAGG